MSGAIDTRKIKLFRKEHRYIIKMTAKGFEEQHTVSATGEFNYNGHTSFRDYLRIVKEARKRVKVSYEKEVYEVEMTDVEKLKVIFAGKSSRHIRSLKRTIEQLKLPEDTMEILLKLGMIKQMEFAPIVKGEVQKIVRDTGYFEKVDKEYWKINQ